MQGRIQLRALARVRTLREVRVYDSQPELAESLAREMSPQLGVTIEAVADLSQATRRSDIVITCTPSRQPILGLSDVEPGAFIAAVGADSEEKQEIDPRLLASAAIVVDVLDQCATFGDLHHAIAAGAVRPEDVRAELGEVVAQTKQGRRSDHEIVVFDSTGTAIQDVAAAAIVYQRALERGVGQLFALAS